VLFQQDPFAFRWHHATASDGGIFEIAHMQNQPKHYEHFVLLDMIPEEASLKTQSIKQATRHTRTHTCANGGPYTRTHTHTHVVRVVDGTRKTNSDEHETKTKQRKDAKLQHNRNTSCCTASATQSGLKT
jgi:hypothetical protein